MALATNFLFTDTAVAGVSSIGATTSSVPNITADWKVMSADVNTGEVTLINLTTPTEAPETLRIQITPVKDVYAGLGLDAAFKAPTSAGVRVFWELRGFRRETDSANAGYQVLMPYRHSHSFTAPAYKADAAKTVTVAARTIGAIGVTGETDIVNGINRLLHGVLPR